MNQRIYILLIGIILSFLVSCDSQKSELDTINFKAKTFKTSPEKKNAVLLHNEYQRFIQKYPNDSLVPTFLYEDAKVLITGMSNFAEGFKNLEKIYNKYPNDRHAPDALQLQAFTYDETLHDYNKARLLYERIIKDYPTHPYAEQAKMLINLLGKDLSKYLQDLEASDSAMRVNQSKEPK